MVAHCVPIHKKICVELWTLLGNSLNLRGSPIWIDADTYLEKKLDIESLMRKH